jgi:hypothetical protein
MRAVTDEDTTQRVRTAVFSLGSERSTLEFALDCAAG